jgi:hypothetical protein
MHDQSEDLGYQSFNAVVILGTIWLFAMIYVFRVLLYFIIKLFYEKKLKQMYPDIDAYEGGAHNVSF